MRSLFPGERLRYGASVTTSASPPKDSSPSVRNWVRTLNRSGQFAGISISGKATVTNDFYHFVMDARWSVVLASVVFTYLTTNLAFAILYLLGGDCIVAARPGSFTDAFFFSVQTMATIGYGAMAPKTTYANILVTIEAVCGLFGVALATGVVFGKFAKPTARVAWSDVAMLTRRNGIPHLLFRVANVRQNQIVEASINVCAFKFEYTTEGDSMRRLFDMNLLRSTNPLFAMSWTVMHPIDEQSPLYGMKREDMMNGNIEILATLTGIDSTFAQTIHARHAYAVDDIKENARFKDLIVDLPDGTRQVDLRRISEWEPIDSNQSAGTQQSKAA